MFFSTVAFHTKDFFFAFEQFSLHPLRPTTRNGIISKSLTYFLINFLLVFKLEFLHRSDNIVHEIVRTFGVLNLLKAQLNYQLLNANRFSVNGLCVHGENWEAPVTVFSHSWKIVILHFFVHRKWNRFQTHSTVNHTHTHRHRTVFFFVLQ